LEKRVSGDDRPLRFVVSGSYEFPFSKHGLRGKLAGGWVLNGIYQIQSGAPLSWGNVIYYGGPLNYNAHNVDRAFDTTRFNTNSKEQLDWNIRTFPSRFNNLRADKSNNLDASLIKNTPITERINLQFRVEFFNALNHPEFNAPNLGASSSDFGRITSQANDIGRVGQLGLRLVW
ncbi:MAG: TonB-dependent receptor, partial [Acidobacteriota bacterium]|nr:TonB-dependent receptor [Acidobacteriota bacterium]